MHEPANYKLDFKLYALTKDGDELPGSITFDEAELKFSVYTED